MNNGTTENTAVSQESSLELFQKSYMPFAVKWGKFSCIIAMVIVFLPALALMVFFGAKPDKAAIVSGIVGMFSAFCAWYVVDPITLFPILGTPGMYMTYVSGNSKEIRAPAALQAMDAADVKGGTPEGTIVSAIAIATSTFVSLVVMTVVAVCGNFLLQILPEAVITSLKYLLPSLFGALAMQRVVLNPKVAAVGIPLAFITYFMKKAGMFSFLPFGGGYASLLICVFVCMFASKMLFAKEHPEMAKKKGQ